MLYLKHLMLKDIMLLIVMDQLRILTSDQVTLGSGGATVEFTGLTANESNVVVNVTTKKIGIESKKKEFIRSEKLTVNGTVSAASTASSGLYNKHIYGFESSR